MIKSLIAKHQIDCDLKPGVAGLALSASDQKQMYEHAAHLSNRYDYDQVELLDAATGHALCPSPAYKVGYLDMGVPICTRSILRWGWHRQRQKPG